MSTARFVEVHVGDVVRLRKPHPCGGTDWTIVRLGADIGLRCEKCGHRIMLSRGVFERRLKAFLSRAVTLDASAPVPAAPIDSGHSAPPPSIADVASPQTARGAARQQRDSASSEMAVADAAATRTAPASAPHPPDFATRTGVADAPLARDALVGEPPTEIS